MLGCGLVLTVAPLTAAVLAAIDVHRAGVGSAINNAVARIAGLLAVAVLPAAAGITALGRPTSARSSASPCTSPPRSPSSAAIVAFLTIRNAALVDAVPLAIANEACQAGALVGAGSEQA